MDTVLVVGGRTTGLMMSVELARRGIPVRCIDKSSAIDPHVRANLIHSRTLEILLSLGLVDKATEGSVAEEGLAYYRNGQLVGESLHQPIDSPFPFGMSQSQAHLEAVLEAHLREYGVEVERGVALTALEQDDNGVNASFQRADGAQETEHYQWLIGCDGAHSEVRHLTGCDFPGEVDPFPYILGDVVVDGDLERGRGHVFFHDNGELFLFSTLPGERRLICANLAAGETTEGAPTLQQLQDVVSERGISSMRLRDPRWLAYFHINYRLAPHYRQGRVFLAGDAAHIHSLLAGQGMNTGIQDAYNLGWKLALVARRHAPEGLLDSYEAERRQVGENVVGMTRDITQAVEQYADLSEEERSKLISHMFTPEPERLNAARHLQEVDLDYHASPISLEVAGEFSGGISPGKQCPEAGPLLVNDEPTTLLQLKDLSAYRLFLFQGQPANADLKHLQRIADGAVSRYGQWLTPYIVTAEETAGSPVTGSKLNIILDQEGAMHRKFEANTACLYLIRPDGYVAYRSRELDSTAKYFDHMSMSRPAGSNEALA